MHKIANKICFSSTKHEIQILRKKDKNNSGIGLYLILISIDILLFSWIPDKGYDTPVFYRMGTIIMLHQINLY